MSRTCWNSKTKEGHWARDTHHPDKGTPIDGWKWIPFVMSRECRYDKKTSDPECKGCKK